MTERRKRYLVQNFQHKLVRRVLTYWVLYHIALWNFLFCWRLLARGGGNVWQEYQQFFWDFYPVLICFLIVVPAFAWDAIRFYHGIAGPLVQFRRAMANIAAEQPVRPIELRKTDQLIELQDDFNRMLDTLVHKNAAALTGHENAPAGCRDMESLQPSVEPPSDGNSQRGLYHARIIG